MIGKDAHFVSRFELEHFEIFLLVLERQPNHFAEFELPFEAEDENSVFVLVFRHVGAQSARQLGVPLSI